jgi:hypothetical protein
LVDSSGKSPLRVGNLGEIGQQLENDLAVNVLKLRGRRESQKHGALAGGDVDSDIFRRFAVDGGNRIGDLDVGDRSTGVPVLLDLLGKAGGECRAETVWVAGDYQCRIRNGIVQANEILGGGILPTVGDSNSPSSGFDKNG